MPSNAEYSHEKRLCKLIILLFALLKLLAGLSTHRDFGLHGDEHFYLTLAEHLDWGYKETSPAIAVTGRLLHTLGATGTFSVRLLPAIAGAAMMWFAGMISLSLGGRRWAVTISSLAILFSPALLATGYMLQPVVFDQLAWTALSLLFVLILKEGGTTKYILLSGFVCGIGLLTKYAVALYIASFFAALVVCRRWSLLRQRSCLGASIIAMIMVLPNLAWQQLHNWPILEQLGDVQRDALANIPPLVFLAQLLQAHGAAILVWPFGLYALAQQDNQRYRPLAVSFIILLLLLIAVQGKLYYAFGIFPLLMAAGGVFIERKTAGRRWVMSLPIVIAFTGITILPSVVPILSRPSELLYFRAMKEDAGIGFPLQWHDGKIHDLPEYYASMLGWKELADKTDKVLGSLTREQRAAAVIFCPDYAMAGAISTICRSSPFPPVLCPSSSFRYWASPDRKALYLILILPAAGRPIPALLRNRLPEAVIEDPHAKIKGARIYYVPLEKEQSTREIERLCQ
ncbi:ArnT family glycosyltransferase [Arcticibacter sp. MXS-1]|uniref:ArnT family glycosyltransferase n=1 Tax=Arcticibacter sp. MXS-1 TaxID=3341726 RepID=UPI0035A9A353